MDAPDGLVVVSLNTERQCTKWIQIKDGVTIFIQNGFMAELF
jgi:hypothetical protein